MIHPIDSRRPCDDISLTPTFLYEEAQISHLPSPSQAPQTLERSLSPLFKKILSSVVNTAIIRDVVFFMWKTSLYFMQLTSRLFQKDFSAHLYTNPIPDYFDFDLMQVCAIPLAHCFIDEIKRFETEIPDEQLFAKISLIRIPLVLKNALIFEECQNAFNQTLKHLLRQARTTHVDPLHLWVGLKETPPSYATDNNPELLAISPDFITALKASLQENTSLSYLHFQGEFGGIETIEPLLDALANVTYIQLSPNDFRRDQIFLLLPSILQSAINLKQIVISSQEESSSPITLTEEYWQHLTPIIATHPNLESIICRNMGTIPEAFRSRIEQAGKHISFF